MFKNLQITLIILLLISSLAASAQAPVLVITYPAPVCSPATVDITAAAITAGSTLPAGTTLTYYADAIGNTVLASPNVISSSNTYYIKATTTLGATDIEPVIVTINSPILPIFPVYPPICSGGASPALLLTSTNDINGIWSPATVSNTATGTYTFTPNTAGQCAMTTTLVQYVNPIITPTFMALAAICNGSVTPVLPTTSINAITGTWSPATVSNTTTGTYIFTPTTGLCVTTMNLVQTVNATPATTPTFNLLPAICRGSAAPILPVTSSNSISGTWSPSTVSNTVTGTYTFTPNAGQCASATTAIETINATPILVVQNPIPVCSPLTVDITAPAIVLNNSFLPPNSFLNYYTNANATVVEPTPNAISLSGIYYITAIVFPSGCSDTVSVAATINLSPSAPTTTSSLNYCQGTVAAPLTATGSNLLWYTNSIGGTGTSLAPVPSTETADVETFYYVSQASVQGCESLTRSLIDVSVNPAPIANAGPAKTICNTDTVKIGTSPVSGNIYTWQPAIGLNDTTSAQPLLSTTTNTVYTLTVTATNGCTAKDSVAITVLHSLDIDLGDTIKQICAGNVIKIGTAAQPDYIYNWSSVPSGFTSTIAKPSIIAPSDPTTYYLTAIDKTTGCSGSAHITLSNDSCKSNKIWITPNPAHQNLTLHLGSNNSEQASGYFELINSKGQSVMKIAIELSSMLTVNISSLHNGEYFYLVTSNNGQKIGSGAILIIN